MNKNKRAECINTRHQRQQTADRNGNERLTIMWHTVLLFTQHYSCLLLNNSTFWNEVSRMLTVLHERME